VKANIISSQETVSGKRR